LLYQQSACAIFKSVIQTNWKPYGLQQSQSALPVGPLTVAVHLASVWPPFTSEAKEAVAHYPEIVKEIKLALQECGRRLGIYVNRKRRAGEERERVNLFEAFIPELADSLSSITGEKKEKLVENLKKMLEQNKEFIIKNQGNVADETDKDDDIKIKGSLESEEE